MDAHPVATAADGTVLAARTAGRPGSPTVLLVHGFPGTSYSWRHQLRHLAPDHRVVAVDLRGYGASGRPDADRYSSEVIEDDLLRVLDAEAADGPAFVVGQDFGAQYAWNLAQRHPHRVDGLVATVPLAVPTAVEPTRTFAEIAARHFLHLHYFQEPGRAERDLGGEHLAEFLLRLFHALSDAGDLLSVFGRSAEVSYLDALPPAPPLPWPWLSEQEFATFLASYASGGPGRELAGGLAAYRAIDTDWLRAREYADVPVAQPSLLVMGDNDPVRTFSPPDPEELRTRATGLEDVVFVPGAGHFVQQEQPAAFNAVLDRFLGDLLSR